VYQLIDKILIDNIRQGLSMAKELDEGMDKWWEAVCQVSGFYDHITFVGVAVKLLFEARQYACDYVEFVAYLDKHIDCFVLKIITKVKATKGMPLLSCKDFLQWTN
jgi:hypothetical protein